MSTVSIHIEGHEDGTLDDHADLGRVLRFIADQMVNENTGPNFNKIPADILLPYVGFEPDPEEAVEDETVLAEFSVQYHIY